MFSSFADLLEWILKHNYEVQFLLHYLDDFHTLGPLDSPVCQQNLDICVLQFSEGGIPLHPDRLQGPSMCLTVLGTELDSLTFRACLSQEKFDHIAALLDTWSSKQHCTRRELESFIGDLWQHACKVIPPGRTFLRQIIYLLSAFDGMTTRSSWSATSVSTLPGGETFSIPGTVSVSYFHHSGHLYLTFTSLQLLLVQGVMGPFLMTSGLLANSPLLNNLYPLHTRNYSRC